MSSTIIYAGPNLPGGTLLQFAAFRGDLPARVKQLISEKPELGKLMIPAAELTAFRLRVQEAGTAEHRAYQEIRGGI